MPRAPFSIPEKIRQLAQDAQGTRCFFCDKAASALCSPNPPDCEQTFGLPWSYTACCKRHAAPYGYQVAVPQPPLRARLRRRGRGQGAGQGGPSMVIHRPRPDWARESSEDAGTLAGPPLEPHHRERISPLGE